MNILARPKSILVTRPARQAAEFGNLLQQSGFEPVLYPCLRIEPAPLEATVRPLADLANGSYDWLIITSQNTIDVLALRLKYLPETIRVACVGNKTAKVFEKRFHREVNFIPSTFNGITLARELPIRQNSRILLPHGDLASSDIAKALLERAHLTTFCCYRSVMETASIHLPAFLKKHQLNAITFFSESAVSFFMQRYKREGGELAALKDIGIVCLAPKTRRKALELGLFVDMVPEVATSQHLIERLLGHFHAS